MTEVELAWVAGLLEGEGTFGVKRFKPCQRHPVPYNYPYVECGMTCRDVVEKLHRVVGLGRMNGPYWSGRKNDRPIWRWTVAKKAEALPLMMQLHPLMGAKRRQQIEAIENEFRARVPIAS